MSAEAQRALSERIKLMNTSKEEQLRLEELKNEPRVCGINGRIHMWIMSFGSRYLTAL